MASLTVGVKVFSQSWRGRGCLAQNNQTNQKSTKRNRWSGTFPQTFEPGLCLRCLRDNGGVWYWPWTNLKAHLDYHQRLWWWKRWRWRSRSHLANFIAKYWFWHRSYSLPCWNNTWCPGIFSCQIHKFLYSSSQLWHAQWHTLLNQDQNGDRVENSIFFWPRSPVPSLTWLGVKLVNNS